jgi:CBS domain-containing protein
MAVGGSDTVLKTIGLSDQVRVTPQFLVLSVLATMNLVIFVFNLLPAWPLDGGRIARAIAWKATGSKVRATVFSANLGRLLSWALAIWGIWEVVGGNMGGLWWLMLAFFIGQSARGAMMQSKISERVQGRTVMELMDRHPVTLPSDTTVDKAADEWFERYGWSWFPVVDPAGRFIGIAHEEKIREAAEMPGLGVPVEVASLIDPATSDGWSVSEMEPIENLLGNGPLARNGALMAVDDDGVLCGVITVEQVYAALNDRSG